MLSDEILYSFYRKYLIKIINVFAQKLILQPCMSYLITWDLLSSESDILCPQSIEMISTKSVLRDIFMILQKIDLKISPCIFLTLALFFKIYENVT